MIKIKPLPSQSTLLKLLRYEPRTGTLFWRERPRSMFASDRIWRAWNARLAGKEAFAAIAAAGYRIGTLGGRGVYAHRVIIKMVLGIDPDEVDHIDGDQSNNRWDNLRPASRMVNCRNTARRSDNKSGVTGVGWARRDRRWVARIHIDQRNISLGYFTTKVAAIHARKVAEIIYGFHPNHGRAA